MRFDIQKADLWKRISAWLFDTIIAFILVVGVAFLLSSALDYDSHFETIEKIKNEVVEKYDINIELSDEEIDALTEEEQKKYADAEKEYATNPDVIYANKMMIMLMLVIVTFSTLITVLITEFIVPIILKHGRTLGKRIFGLAVIRTNGVKISGQALFIRALIGKYTLEIMAPAYILLLSVVGMLGIMGIILDIVILILQIFSIIRSGYRSTIHDLVSDTVVVDFSSQMIFESEEELVAYKTRIHAEEANKREY